MCIKKSVTRTCSYCECVKVDDGINLGKILIYRDSINNVILFDDKYYHKDCFLEMCNKKIEKRKLQKWILAIENIKLYEIAAQTAIKEHFNKDDVYRWMLESYTLTVIPSQTWKKINRIYAGEIDGMSIGIPPEHLYDMWKRKINYLNKIWNNNKTKGKEMDGAQKLNYDLTVLVNQYDSYLSWLNKQKILEAEENTIHTNILQNVDLQKMSKQNNNNKNSNNENMDDLLNELFD